MAAASEAILALKPVTFRYKEDLDPAGTAQFGLVAEEVARIDPDLVGRDEQGKPYTVRYEAVNAMLLNEFLKEHRKVEKMETRMAEERKKFESALVQQQKQIAGLTIGLKEQAAQLRKINSQPHLAQQPQLVSNTKQHGQTN
ncbi:MAG: tail fiber domain-containing protein [Chthoniobacterales bacterium]|nr:tail fiber domain-containing protein [Chthoniobacterales bacterium]